MVGKRGFGVVALVVSLLGTWGCDDKKPTGPVGPAVSSLAASPVAPSAKTIKLTVDPKSKATLDMPAPKEHIKAFTDAAAGSLTVDPTNLTNSRGEIKMDLTTLTMNHFGNADDASQTKHARCWLEVTDCEEGKLSDETKAANKYAVYAIRAIENASATDLTKVPATKEGDDEVRNVTLTTKGELLIHGHKVEREADAEVSFHYAPGGDAAKPKSLVIKTKKPLRVVLAEHDVKPCDNFGKIAKGAFNLLGTKVADNADISLEIKAKSE